MNTKQLQQAQEYLNNILTDVSPDDVGSEEALQALNRAIGAASSYLSGSTVADIHDFKLDYARYLQTAVLGNIYEEAKFIRKNPEVLGLDVDEDTLNHLIEQVEDSVTGSLQVLMECSEDTLLSIEID